MGKLEGKGGAEGSSAWRKGAHLVRVLFPAEVPLANVAPVLEVTKEGGVYRNDRGPASSAVAR
jgi:hypothetical protein